MRTGRGVVVEVSVEVLVVSSREVVVVEAVAVLVVGSGGAEVPVERSGGVEVPVAVHMTPSPQNPGLQAHSNDPAVFLHKA